MESEVLQKLRDELIKLENVNKGHKDVKERGKKFSYKKKNFYRTEISKCFYGGIKHFGEHNINKCYSVSDNGNWNDTSNIYEYCKRYISNNHDAMRVSGLIHEYIFSTK